MKQLVKPVYCSYLAAVLIIPPAVGLAVAFLLKSQASGDARTHFIRQSELGWWWLRWSFLAILVSMVVALISGNAVFVFGIWIPSLLMMPKAWEGLQHASHSATHEIDPEQVVDLDSAPTATAGDGLLAQNRTDASATDLQSSVADVESKIKEQLPLVKEKCSGILAKAGSSIADYGAEKLFGEVHGLLPFPMRVVVRKRPFVRFCMDHQDTLSL